MKNKTKSQKNHKLKPIQAELLRFYKDLAKLLNQNKIEFFACDGTMIGAVREKGFIPWDDDIDLYLTRPNFEKLLKIARKNQNKIGIFDVATAELGNSLLTFCKIFDKRYKLNAKGVVGDEDYLFIDIFILDGVPNNSNERQRFLKEIVEKRRYLAAARLTFTGLFHDTKNKFLYPVKVMLKLSAHIRGTDKLLKEYLSLCKRYKYDDCDYVECLTWSSVTAKDIKIAKSDLKPVIFPFEDTKIPIFKGYDAYLTAYFGNYMKRPDKSGQVTHEIEIISEEK